MNVIKKIVVNRKAKFEYEIIDKYVAGIMLEGFEVKPIRAGNCSITEAHCFIDDNGVQLKNLTLSESVNGDINRTKKLLLNKKEINKLKGEISKKGLTLIPLAVLTTKTGLIKLEIGLCRGKNVRDKRESIRSEDIKRETQRELNKGF